MARGPSGRIVIEVDPTLKRELHAALAADGTTVKDWFITQARSFVWERRQPSLPGISQRASIPAESLPSAAGTPPEYRVTRKTQNKGRK